MIFLLFKTVRFHILIQSFPGLFDPHLYFGLSETITTTTLTIVTSIVGDTDTIYLQLLTTGIGDNPIYILGKFVL